MRTNLVVRWAIRSCLWAFICEVPACTNGAKDSAPDVESVRQAGQAAISDELRSGGTPGFVFLPPMVREPGSYGDFVPDLPVTLRIDELNTDGSVLRSLATFTPTSGPEGERLRIHYQGHPYDAELDDGDHDVRGYYYARWHTGDANLTPAALYRVRVLIPAKGGLVRELGFADVAVVASAGEFRNVERSTFVPLLNGSTLRIKFRVDWPAVDKDRDGVFDWLDNCPTTANPDQVDSLQNGVGDACRCEHVRCASLDSCHVRGECEATTGICTNPTRNNGAACALPHADASCMDGLCQLISCRSGHADCNADPFDGCETRITTTDNCGECGVVCTEGVNSRAECRHGNCRLRCDRGYADCDGDATTGCEQSTSTDVNNCGACGHICENHQGCARGACTTAVCQDPYGDCDGNSDNGCELDLTSDAGNCGACKRVCEIANGVAGCAAEACTVSSCNDGYADCNAIPDDGCEIDLMTDANNCTACGMICEVPNGLPGCIAPDCVVAQCFPGFADCDGDFIGGCEVSLETDPGNCGACGYACTSPNASPSCQSGKCGMGACNTGFADCNGLTTDGCEVNLLSDSANCSACGSPCPTLPNAQAACASGACSLVCNSGYADCDAVMDNGCETDVQGICGVCACPTPPNTVAGECRDGVCGFSVCLPGYADCDGNVANGCEVRLATNSANCGACGNSCSSGNRCSAGLCVEDKCLPWLSGNASQSRLLAIDLTEYFCRVDRVLFACVCSTWLRQLLGEIVLTDDTNGLYSITVSLMESGGSSAFLSLPATAFGGQTDAGFAAAGSISYLGQSAQCGFHLGYGHGVYYVALGVALDCVTGRLTASGQCNEWPCHRLEIGMGIYDNIDYTFQTRATSYAAEYDIPVQLANSAVGTALQVQWQAPATHSPNDWIGLYLFGSTNTAVLTQTILGNVGVTRGTSTIDIPATLASGTYDVRLFQEGGSATPAAWSQPFKISN